jgi:hypothetical protein
MELCSYRSVIPFEDPPAENEDALPHQPDLDSLKLSAKTCRLCNLLSKAVNKLLKEIEERGRNVQAHFCLLEAGTVNVGITSLYPLAWSHSLCPQTPRLQPRS